MKPNRKLNRKRLPQHTPSYTWWGKTDASCVCVRARVHANALITIIPNIHRSPPTCRINIRNLLYVLHAASASAPTTVSAPGWIRACLICNEGSQGCAEGSESGENIYPLYAIPPCFPINQFLCPLVLVLFHTGACSGLDVGGMMHFLGSQEPFHCWNWFYSGLRDFGRLVSSVSHIYIKCVLPLQQMSVLCRLNTCNKL